MTASTKDKDDLVATLRDVAAKLGDMSDRLGQIERLAREQELCRAKADLQAHPARQRPQRRTSLKPNK